MILKQAFPLKIRVWNEILWRKDSDYEAYFFLKYETLNWKFFNMSDFELRIYRPGRYRKQNFSNNQFLEKTSFPETQFLTSIFIEKPGFVEKFTSEKKRFDSICSRKNNIVFTFRAYFERHDFEVNLFFENQKFEMEFFERNVGFWSEVFSYNLISFKIESFLSWRISLKNFSKKYFVETNIFLKIRFSVQFISRNQISIKTSGLRNNVLTRFAPRPTTSFSLCMLILKGMTL